MSAGYLRSNAQRSTLNVQRSTTNRFCLEALGVERLPQKKNARTIFGSGISENFTPPMPFRRISRSLSVTGG